MSSVKALNDYIFLEKDKSVKKIGVMDLSAAEKDNNRYDTGVIKTLSVNIPEGTLNVGDKVYYTKGQSFTMFIDETEVVVVRLRDIIGAE